jgi:3D (Asp-Asp-Asp) domain-containing protein
VREKGFVFFAVRAIIVAAGLLTRRPNEGTGRTGPRRRFVMSKVERSVAGRTEGTSRRAAARSTVLVTTGRALVKGALLATLLTLAACAARQEVATAPPPPPAPEQPKTETFEATAYSIEGETANGDQTRKGIVAADPKILPLGSRIRVHDAGAYSGEYTVSDTGRAVKGREIDIYLPNDREAKEFGRKTVRVELISSAK